MISAESGTRFRFNPAPDFGVFGTPDLASASLPIDIQTLRGVSLLVAAVIVAAVGRFNRFASPRLLMAYLGLNPSEQFRPGWR